MIQQRSTIFISDLHLDENNAETSKCFQNLLANCVEEKVDALYILGDLFEAWIGDDENTPFHQEIIQALKSATQSGLSIYLMYGNRDFLLGNKFLKATGCQLLPDEAKIDLYNTPVLLMHGDTLCTRDAAYLKARKKMRNVILQKLFLLLPLKFRKKIADKMRAQSVRYTQTTPLEIMDVTEDAVKQVMQKYGVKYLIHGHTHRPAFHEFTLGDDTSAMRIVLGAWHERGNMLVWDASGKKEWMEINEC